MSRFIRVTMTALISALALVVAALAPPASAAGAPAAALPCRASMTNSHPADFTTTGVMVSTVPFAHIKTVAHYRTTNHVKFATANAQGRRTVRYFISGATPGFRVVVNVYVSRNNRTGSCKTSFTPHA